MANGQITRTTVHLRKRTPEEQEAWRIENQRWEQAEKEADERAARKQLSGPTTASK